jgi:hypothetical protein
VLNHPVLDELDSSIRNVVPGESVEFGGEWTTASRRSDQARLSTGAGPLVDIVDVQWRGALTSAGTFSGIAFLLTADNLHWVKAPEVALALPVGVSLHAYAGDTANGATFTASLAGAHLPGVRVAGSPDLAGTCTLGPEVLVTGRVTCLARTDAAALFVLLIPGGLLKMGRKHLWRLRDDAAASLPSVIGDLLGHRRTGSFRSQ